MGFSLQEPVRLELRGVRFSAILAVLHAPSAVPQGYENSNAYTIFRCSRRGRWPSLLQGIAMKNAIFCKSIATHMLRAQDCAATREREGAGSLAPRWWAHLDLACGVE